MRIIDKNKDFYDYLQFVYKDYSTTFDRTDSYLLTKEEICNRLCFSKNQNYEGLHFLLQVCNTFWLFAFDMTKTDRHGDPIDYDISLVATWKNYNKCRTLITLDFISISRGSYRVFKTHSDTDVLIQAIDTSDYRTVSSLKKCKVCTGDRKWEDRHIPILKASGFAKYIDPLEIYLSFEEFFSLERTVSERSESVGITDKEKIENHGFDVKKSFRGR